MEHLPLLISHVLNGCNMITASITKLIFYSIVMIIYSQLNRVEHHVTFCLA
jgi:hypothetical protein